MNTTLPARRISAGGFIRIEALEELGLSVAAAGRILGERRAILSDLVKGVVPRGAANDAAHIAIAAASGVDF
ncbi:MAG: hypothetical protein OXU19_05895, partial [bacterium]|nr:hypothetical protein [bacterium]